MRREKRGDGGGLTNVGAFTRYFEGEAEFTVLVGPDGRETACRVTPAQRGCFAASAPGIGTVGVVRIAARAGDGGIRGMSNPCCVGPGSAPELYWGDIHGMTEISAGPERPAGVLQADGEMAWSSPSWISEDRSA